MLQEPDQGTAAQNAYDYVTVPPNIEHELQARVAKPLRMQGV
jgi:hypothetical protein